MTTKSFWAASSGAAVLGALALLAACGGSGKDKDCTPDFTAVEQQRVQLCGNRQCGDVAFKDDICGFDYERSCGACRGGETCHHGICAACTSHSDCAAVHDSGWFCNDSWQCEAYEDHCDTLADCEAKGGGRCEDHRCVVTRCGDGSEICDDANHEQCLSEICMPVRPLTECSVTGSTTAQPTVVQFFEHLDGPEAIYAYTAPNDDTFILTVSPIGIDYDPAIYILSRLSPPAAALGGDALEEIVADEYAKGRSEMVLLTPEAGKTYYIVISSDSEKSGAYKQGAFTLCLENATTCTQTCETK